MLCFLASWDFVGVGRDWVGLGCGFFFVLFFWAFYGAVFFLWVMVFFLLSFLFFCVIGGSGVLSHGVVFGFLFFYFFHFSIFLCGHWDIS